MVQSVCVCVRVTCKQTRESDKYDNLISRCQLEVRKSSHKRKLQLIYFAACLSAALCSALHTVARMQFCAMSKSPCGILSLGGVVSQQSTGRELEACQLLVCLLNVIENIDLACVCCCEILIFHHALKVSSPTRWRNCMRRRLIQHANFLHLLNLIPSWQVVYRSQAAFCFSVCFSGLILVFVGGHRKRHTFYTLLLNFHYFRSLSLSFAVSVSVCVHAEPFCFLLALRCSSGAGTAVDATPEWLCVVNLQCTRAELGPALKSCEWYTAE